MEKDGMLLKVFLCASLGSLIWLGSFVLLSGAFEVRIGQKKAPVPQQTSVTELPTVYSSGWTIFAAEGENGELAAFYLQYADFIRDTLVFVRVPADTKIELSSGAFEVLRVHRPEMPKLFMISELRAIAGEDLFCMAAEEAMGSLLGVRPKGCYLLPKKLFDRIFEENDGKLKFRSEESVPEIIRRVQETAVTDKKAAETMVFTESYCDIKEIYSYTIPGSEQQAGYRTDPELVKEMTERFLAGLFEEEP